MILTWDADRQQYTVRQASTVEKMMLSTIKALMKDIKKFYYAVIDDAAAAHQSVDLFIDNECYYAWKESCKKAEEVTKLADILGIKMGVWSYVHWF